MKLYPFGNNLAMVYGLMGSTSSDNSRYWTAGSYCSSNMTSFCLSLLDKIQKGISEKVVNEAGAILFIAPYSYTGVEVLEGLGLKAMMSVKNPNSSNRCSHFVESVPDLLRAIRAHLVRRNEEFSLGDQVNRMAFEGISNIAGADAARVLEYLNNAIPLIDQILEGEDENQ